MNFSETLSLSTSLHLSFVSFIRKREFQMIPTGDGIMNIAEELSPTHSQWEIGTSISFDFETVSLNREEGEKQKINKERKGGNIGRIKTLR